MFLIFTDPNREAEATMLNVDGYLTTTLVHRAGKRLSAGRHGASSVASATGAQAACKTQMGQTSGGAISTDDWKCPRCQGTCPCSRAGCNRSSAGLGSTSALSAEAQLQGYRSVRRLSRFRRAVQLPVHTATRYMSHQLTTSRPRAWQVGQFQNQNLNPKHFDP